MYTGMLHADLSCRGVGHGVHYDIVVIYGPLHVCLVSGLLTQTRFCVVVDILVDNNTR